ncbi:STAS domain-containing protein [Massilia sp. TN1-12]|uniref:STAS domain-containing protein n=1 Tax=Massilia paldalensis TaxID=3377675 RepID=UPI00384B56D6
MGLDNEAERERQRAIARATAAKIDEIELEMIADIFDDETWAGKRRVPAAASGIAIAAPPSLDTDRALGAEELPDAAAVPSSAPAVEEAAILYANDQLGAACTVLRASLAEAGSERQPWWMLFDLYQILGQESEFDSVAIDYASRFETSPPAWTPLSPAGTAPARQFAGAVPTAVLSGKLDESIEAQLARVLAPSPSPLVRFEFQAVTHATPAGCALLLSALQALRAGERELVLAGADQLATLLRPMLAIGERTASEAPWLLLLELLLLANREKDFEETAMDYCLTFEVSPPSFEAPKLAAISLGAGPGPAADRFLLPAAIRGDATALLDAIAAHAARYPALVLDCSRLAHIDYAAANALAAQLRGMADQGRDVVLRDLNHVVAVLLRLLGAGELVRLYAHKY